MVVHGVSHRRGLSTQSPDVLTLVDLRSPFPIDMARHLLTPSSMNYTMLPSLLPALQARSSLTQSTPARRLRSKRATANSGAVLVLVVSQVKWGGAPTVGVTQWSRSSPNFDVGSATARWRRTCSIARTAAATMFSVLIDRVYGIGEGEKRKGRTARAQTTGTTDGNRGEQTTWCGRQERGKVPPMWSAASTSYQLN
jgi:hypothetical protein